MHRLFASCAAALMAAALLTMPTVPPAFDGQAMAQTRGDEEGASDRLDERRFRSPYDPPPTVDQDREAQSRAEARRDAERRQARREAEERRLIEEHYRREQRQRDGDRRAAERGEAERRAARRRDRDDERDWARAPPPYADDEARYRDYERRYREYGRDRDYHRDDDRRYGPCLSRRQIARRLKRADLHVHTWIPRGERYRIIAHNSKADRYDLTVDACRGDIIEIQRTKQAGGRGFKRFWRRLRRTF